jgi:hypothetical protein
MARLYVEAVSSVASAADANRNPVHLGVSVTDGNGNGVAGLTSGNFTIATPTVAAGGAIVVISSVSGATIAGGYQIQILPTGVQNWDNGTYNFILDVDTGTDDGQTAVNVTVPL